MSGLFGMKSSPPPPPPPIPTMPDEEGPAIKEAKRKKMASIMARSGRGASILSQATESAGAYERGALGGP